MKFDDFKKRSISKDARLGELLGDSDENFRFEVAHLITAARLKAGFTQEQLARAVGTKQSSIARLEAGRQLPTLSFLKKIATAIGTHLVPPRYEFMNDFPSVTYYVNARELFSDDSSSISNNYYVDINPTVTTQTHKITETCK